MSDNPFVRRKKKPNRFTSSKSYKEQFLYFIYLQHLFIFTKNSFYVFLKSNEKKNSETLDRQLYPNPIELSCDELIYGLFRF